MVQLNRIYTRTGDHGETGLGTGERVPKHSLRVAAFGTVDEANATIGLVRLATSASDSDERLQAIDAVLSRIQNDLFDLGADLCVPEPAPGAPPPEWTPLRIVAGQVAWLETTIDAFNTSLKPLSSFILPAGTPAASYLHLARTVTRRAERLLSELSAAEPVNPQAFIYLNRLSDLLFVLARTANGNGAGDVLWVPGANR